MTVKKILTYFLSSLKWIVAGIFGLVAIVLILLYIPPVQDFVINRVINQINASGDMHLSVKKLRLSFPAKLAADSLSMHTSGMEIKAAHLHTGVNIMPLLTGHVVVPDLSIEKAIVNIGTPDSTMYMQANLNSASLTGTSVNLSANSVKINDLEAAGGIVNMILTADTVPQPVKETEPVKWKISLDHAGLKDISYKMQYEPTIVELLCNLPEATLKHADIDLGKSMIDVNELAISQIDARYITSKAEQPDSASLSPDTVKNISDSIPTAPWTIRADKLRLSDSHAIYATQGAVPSEHFDPSYIEASEINIEVDSFLNRGSAITIPVKRISARERCGIALDLAGTFAMDSTAMYAHNFMVTTPSSSISLDATMGLDTVHAPVSINLGAEIGMDDISRLAPPTLTPIISKLPQYKPLRIAADISGNMNDLNITRISAEIPRHITISAEGKIANYTDIDKARGNIELTGAISDGNFIKTALLDAKMRRTVNIPPLRIEGSAALSRGIIDGRVRALTKGGDIAMDAVWNNRVQGYDINADFNDFPVQAILPTMGIRDLNATITAKGEGFDFFSPKTHTDASVVLNHVTYNGTTYRNITLDALLSGGEARIEARSANPGVDFDINAAGNLTGQQLDWTFDGIVRHIDLHALALSDTTASGSVSLNGKASFIPPVAATQRTPGRAMTLNADMNISDLVWQMPGQQIKANNIDLAFNTADSITDARLRNNDLALDFSTPVSLDTLMSRITATSARLDHDIARRRLSIDTLQNTLPPFTLAFNAGVGNNLLADFLSGNKISFSKINLNAKNDSIIHARALVTRLKTGNTLIDTITLNLHQRGAYMLYEANMSNRPGTFDQFANVSAKGYLSDNFLALLFKQQNIQGETGYSIGLMAQMPDSSNVSLRFVPFHPIIGYKEWEINKDNVIKFNLVSKHLDANLHLRNSESSIKLFTEHSSAGDSLQEDINLQISDIKLADWIALNPFAPPITGNLSADMKLNLHLPDINGKGVVSLTDFKYDRQKVGDFDLDIDLSTNAAGTVRATTALMVNGTKAITATGNLNDSTAANPFLLDFRMIRFPLSVANPFLPRGTAQLSGVLNGQMDVTGSPSDPQFNGYLDFDTTTVNVTMLGTPFHFSEDKIPVENNIVMFKDFSITGANSNPLFINGNVDLKSISSPLIDLSLTARNMQVVGSQRSRKSQAYGKAYINLDSKIKGSLSMLDIDASLNILPGTNVTYVMPDAVNTITSRSTQDMVKFVNFNDTTQVEETDTIGRSSMVMNIDAQLTVSTGTTIAVDLSTDGKDRVQLQSNGNLSYTQDYMNDQRFTGRLNISGGFVRYSIPVMGEKLFNFQEGSYVAFNGDMMNPILNVIAEDNIRANVSVNNNNRVVNFTVGLNVTGTLDEMNVAFDLSCPDDITIANELKGMTAEQRANQAMNLLISGTYRSGGTQTISGGNAGTNALFSFLESQLNSWASSSIKGVDISFGINQYDKTVDGANTTTMNYSYRVSKSLFNDRFKIIVGGNYTTDAEADENFAQNLIADISFEYMLNRAGTMYVRLFRHTGYESILEGEITQTGVGFVYKKKIRRIGDIFKFLKPKKRRREAPLTSPQEIQAPQPEPPASPVSPAPSDAVIADPQTTNTKNAADDENIL